MTRKKSHSSGQPSHRGMHVIPGVEPPYSVPCENDVGGDKDQSRQYDRRQEIAPMPVESYLPVETEKEGHCHRTNKECQIQRHGFLFKIAEGKYKKPVTPEIIKVGGFVVTLMSPDQGSYV